MVQAMSLNVGKVTEGDNSEWVDLEWMDLFHYIQFNYSRLLSEGRLTRLVHRLNYLAGYEKVDPLSIPGR